MSDQIVTAFAPPNADVLYNLPFVSNANRGEVYSSVLKGYANGRKLNILEIGVFKAGLIIAIHSLAPEIIDSYTGVDPYIGDESDPYFKSYWKSEKSVADKQFEESEEAFSSRGGKLIRSLSDDYFAKTTDTFDVVIVDGDHRVQPAYRDLMNALKVLRPGGLLVCDDYGNSDTPEVTRAVVKFVAEAGDFYDAAGLKPIWFQNAGKPAPIQLSAIYWRKRPA